MGYKIERESRELAYQGSILKIYRDHMKLPDGSAAVWDFVSHGRGGACIVPVLPDGRILMIRQYRPAIDRETLELPAGARDSVKEDTEVTARRELLEETGYTAERWERLLQLKTAVAYCDEFTDVYLAENIQKVSGQQLDEAEEIRVTAWEPEALLDKVYAGEIQDSKTVAGILAYYSRSKRRRSEN